MVATRQIRARDGDVLVLAGTMKGLFLLRSDARRSRWEVGGPHFPGLSVYALAYDGRDSLRRIHAGNQSFHWGAVIQSSDDFGRTWTPPEASTLKFPADTGLTLKQVWQIRPGRPDEPGTLHAGVEPASLFTTHDGGQTWALARGLHEHPHRPRWEPGGGGLCLHTILPDPGNRRRIFVAISTGGVYRSDDGGRTWAARNNGVRADFLPDKHPEFGQCVHKIVQHPANPDRLYLQNHGGLYRSDDGADSWQEIASGVPSDFGFAMAQHPHDPDTVFIVPLESDRFRCTPEGKLRVYRTRNAGASWEPLTRGLPQKHALETVLRDAMTTDTLDPAGVYFGTRSGHLWGSRDAGASWELLLGGLPPIVCVRAALVGEPGTARRGRPVPIRTRARKSRPAPRRPGRRPARKSAVRKPVGRGRGRR
jgi:hypothetical protein